jgi:hypothetical protein
MGVTARLRGQEEGRGYSEAERAGGQGYSEAERAGGQGYIEAERAGGQGYSEAERAGGGLLSILAAENPRVWLSVQL